MSRYQRNSEAIVLKRINVGDKDRVYTFLTPDRGRVSAIAKGVRKITSKRSGNLDTLNHVVVSFSESAAGHKAVAEVKLINSFKNVKSSLDRSQVGYYFAELVNKSVNEDSEVPEVFELLRQYLGLLDNEDSNIRFIMNKFEVLLMKALGYEISLERLRGFGKEYMNERIKGYIQDTLDEKFKSLEI